MPLETITLKVNVPLTFEEILGLETDIDLLFALLKAHHAEIPKDTADRMTRTRELLHSIRTAPKQKFWKYKFPKGVVAVMNRLERAKEIS